MITKKIFDIEFEIFPEIDLKTIENRFKEPLKYIKSSMINYIEIGDLDEIYIYMNKNGEPENEWNETTIQFAQLLNKFGFDAFLSDQDYGYIDVIVINEWL